MDLGLAGRHALVLGASRGLGGATARSLALEGAHVVAASRSGTAAWIEGLPSEIAARITTAKLDLTDRASVAAFAETMRAGGQIDILVNNSGGPPPGSVQAVEAATWDNQFAAMATHLFEVSRALLPAMLARKWGRIITIASSGVAQPIPNLGISNTVRASIVGWSKSLADEVAGQGVTVNVVLPGRIHTSRVDELDLAAAKRNGKNPADVAAASAAAIPAGRYGTPHEFADVITFLASARASYVTGSRIRVDGGAIRGI